MASQFDETFYNETIRNSQLDNLMNSSIIFPSQKRKTVGGRKSVATRNSKGENSKTANTDKENAVTKNKEEKKQGRTSAESNREVLQVLNENRLSKSPKEKPAASPRKNKIDALIEQVKEMQAANGPKIVIFQDSSCEETRSRETVRRQESKSWGGNRISVNENPELVVTSITPSCRSKSSSKSPKEKLKPKSSPKIRKSPLRVVRGSPVLNDDETSLLAKIENVFPNGDPEFLKAQFVKFQKCLPTTIEYLILKEKENDLPSKADYLKRQETEKLQKEYLKNFSVENFLKMFPDPWEHFLKQSKEECRKYESNSLYYLKTKFRKHYTQTIQTALEQNNYSLYRTCKELKKKNRQTKMRVSSRSKAECGKCPTNYNEQFMHEVGFIENEAKIRQYIKKRETAIHKKFMEAKNAGTLLECEACNDPSLLSDNAVNCPANHVFCKDCVAKSVNAELDKHKFRFNCLVNCGNLFSMESLQKVLTSETIERIQRVSQVEEIKAAEIQDLIWCPFCTYATIMPPEVSVFNCLNPECLRESCRHCKQVNHIPLKCRELEKFILEDEIDKKESKEPEKPILTCNPCNKEFMKTDETNKLVCSCGATICSICQQRIPEGSQQPGTHLSKEVSPSCSGADVIVDTADDNTSVLDGFAFDESLNPRMFFSI